MTRPDAVSAYNVGDLVRCVATITASGGVLTNPSSLVMTLVSPSGIASYVLGQAGASIANPGAGMFYKDITAGYIGTFPEAGKWLYAFQASGIVQAAEEWEFIVESKIWT